MQQSLVVTAGLLVETKQSCSELKKLLTCTAYVGSKLQGSTSSLT